MDAHTLITCLIAVTLLTITPGVDTMLVIRNSARGGWWDGAMSSLGICSGLFIHATVSALGISLILLHTAWAFTTLKMAGGAYLIWLGGTSLRQAAKGETNLGRCTGGGSGRFILRRSLREGFLSNVLNPKAVIFYMAFLPQFIDPAGSPLLQSLMVATIHFTVGMVYQCILAAMVERARDWLQRPDVNRIFNGLTGSFLVGIGLRLATEK